MDRGNNINPASAEHILKSWENPEHRRLRIQPKPGDVEYPVLGALNDFIKMHASPEKKTILDYGAGTSPYRNYFTNADYRRADVLDSPGLDYRIGPTGQITEKDESFDLVLSTQVLEHVEHVAEYLSESFRLLKQGGSLLLTTHGTWEEHGVPFDFQRWTEEGMRRDLRAAGYRQIDIYKLTCGMHAGLFLFIKSLFSAPAPSVQPARLFFKIFRTTISKIYPWLYRFCDRHWPVDRIVKATPDNADKTFYIIIAVIARK
jgi:SAM-dependent methyltransferase